MDGEDRRDGGDAAVEAAGDSIVLVCSRPTADGRRRAQELAAALQATGVAAVCDTCVQAHRRAARPHPARPDPSSRRLLSLRWQRLFRQVALLN